MKHGMCGWCVSKDCHDSTGEQSEHDLRGSMFYVPLSSHYFLNEKQFLLDYVIIL
jgi:hypothetical protein